MIEGKGEEALLLVEHEPVVTLGRSAKRQHLLFAPEQFAERGVELVETSRGGDVTYHGPGQLVGYPVMRLQAGVLGHVRGMLEGVADVARELGVDAQFRRECPGLWVDDAKLCAVGVHIRRAVAIHGFALNVAEGLFGFQWIVPCGLSAPVTSLERLGVKGQTPALLAERVACAVAARFDRVAQRRSLKELHCVAAH